MDKKKSDESAATRNGKYSSKESKKEKVSVLANLAGMDQKYDKPKKGSSSRAKTAPKDTSYPDDLDYPPYDEEDKDKGFADENRGPMHAMGNQENKQNQLDFSVTDKKQKKVENKERLALQAADISKREALKEDDHDAFTVVMGSKTSVLEGEDTGDANVKDITINSFSFSVRGKELVKNASLTISHGKRYGLVGPNGMGKSTLLKLLAWRKIPVPKNIDVLLVEQEVVGDGTSALEAVVSANKELVKLRKEAEALEAAALQNSSFDDTGAKLTEVYDKLQELRSDAAEAQASKILAGLGFTEDMLAGPTKLLSGGWRMRISLARALFVRPTLLLLDEPTNHLDLRAVVWLEEYLCRWKNTLVVVSHNVDFLNTVCTDIIHLHDQSLHFYRGNFDAFETGYGQRRKEMNKKFEIYEKRVKAAKRSGNRAQQEKVKEWAQSAAAKEASKRIAKGKKKGPAPEAPRKWRDYEFAILLFSFSFFFARID